MRKLASIQKVTSITPIEGADRIELAHILGWQCVVKKGEFHSGDLCVYFEIDSFLPLLPEFEFLKPNSYKKDAFMGEGYRIRTARFKGEISQGLILPLVELKHYIPDGIYNVGQDVTAVLGVKEWEIPEKVSNSGTIIGEAKKYISITDETRIQSMPELLNEFKNVPYYITTKLDGSSHSVYLDVQGNFHVFGHNYEYKDDGKSSFYEYCKSKNIKEKLEKYLDAVNDFYYSQHGLQIPSITVQGEWCGGGIQGNKLHLKKPDWFIFTVTYGNDRRPWNVIESLADYLGVPHVPLEEEGEDLTKNYPTIDSLLDRSGENRCHIYPGACEGIVIRPQTPVHSDYLHGWLSMKVISNKYLLKQK